MTEKKLFFHQSLLRIEFREMMHKLFMRDKNLQSRDSEVTHEM
jgi:hypothetical protein